jgi:hypothetical protein
MCVLARVHSTTPFTFLVTHSISIEIKFFFYLNFFFHSISDALMKHDGPREIQISINLLQSELLSCNIVCKTLQALALNSFE